MVAARLQGHEKTILVEQFDHSVHIPTDPQSGLPTGKRIHRPFTVTAMIDPATPKIFQALCSGEHLKSVVLEFYAIAKQGKDEKYYTTKLEDAVVVKVRPWIPNGPAEGKPRLAAHGGRIPSPTKKCIWTWVKDGIETEDSWQVPK